MTSKHFINFFLNFSQASSTILKNETNLLKTLKIFFLALQHFLTFLILNVIFFRFLGDSLYFKFIFLAISLYLSFIVFSLKKFKKRTLLLFQIKKSKNYFLSLSNKSHPKFSYSTLSIFLFVSKKQKFGLKILFEKNRIF